MPFLTSVAFQFKTKNNKIFDCILIWHARSGNGGVDFPESFRNEAVSVSAGYKLRLSPVAKIGSVIPGCQWLWLIGSRCQLHDLVPPVPVSHGFCLPSEIFRKHFETYKQKQLLIFRFWFSVLPIRSVLNGNFFIKKRIFASALSKIFGRFFFPCTPNRHIYGGLF